MSGDKSADEEQQEHIQVMGQDLGTLCHALDDEVAWLHVKWQVHLKLYADSPERIDLLNSVAAFFFSLVQRVLGEDVLLHLARLTDPPRSGGRRNLTLRKLPEAISEPTLAADVKTLVETAVSHSSFARDWRNRRLAHRDLDLVLGVAKPLDRATRQQVEDALEALRAVLDRVHKHYQKPTVGLEHVGTTGGGVEDLVHHLQFATDARARLFERLQQGKLLPEDRELLLGKPLTEDVELPPEA